MSSGQNRQDLPDLPFLLFLVPFAASAVYAIYLWVGVGLSATLPSTVFLEVTESPYVFLVGFVAVIAGAALDVTGVDPEKRRAKLIEESNTLQKLAVVALVLGLICAWYSAGFDLGTAASNVFAGRYVVVFPALVILFSFLFLPSVTIKSSQVRNVVIILLLLGAPLAIDEVGKRNFFAGMGAGIALTAVALYLYFTTKARDAKSA
jgi:hypothetical protein